MTTLKVSHGIYDNTMIGKKITVTGRLSRLSNQKKFIFGELDDGTPDRLQFIHKINAITEFVESATVGSSVTLSGVLVKAPAKATQSVELNVTDASVISAVRDPMSYRYGTSSAKQRTSEEWMTYLKGIRKDLRGRFRHKIMQSVMRIRGRTQAELIAYLTNLDFIKIDAPILTKSDCEGAGEMFTVTTLPLDKVPTTMTGHVDYSEDFFGEKCYLTVSGQLEAEALAQCLHNVYTFGPTFRAEHSLTSRHLAEFWMLEPEMVFSQEDPEERFQALMDFQESMICHVVKFMLTPTGPMLKDLQILDSSCSPGLIAKLQKVTEKPFVRKTYTECIDILKLRPWESEIVWGMDLTSEHERYLCDKVFKTPTFVTHYPQDLKSFYMKADEITSSDHLTCQAVDLLVPGIGELCGGSMREEDPDKMVELMKKKGMSLKQLKWYIELRYDGAFTTGGFGLGFERLISFITGLTIREISAFPKYYKSM